MPPKAKPAVAASSGNAGAGMVALVPVPPAISFGDVEIHRGYRRTLLLRNVGVGSTRFKIVPPVHPCFTVSYTPQNLAPGISAAVTVDLLSAQPEIMSTELEVVLPEGPSLAVPISATSYAELPQPHPM